MLRVMRSVMYSRTGSVETRRVEELLELLQ